MNIAAHWDRGVAVHFAHWHTCFCTGRKWSIDSIMGVHQGSCRTARLVNSMLLASSEGLPGDCALVNVSCDTLWHSIRPGTG